LSDLRALVEERFGVAVLVRRLESKGVTAVCVRAEDAGAIVLDARDPLRAQNPLIGRVHLAHELCHALFDPSPGGVHVVVDLVLDRKTQQAEQRARAFAAELLLPLQGIKQMVDRPGVIRDPQAALDLIGRVRSRFGTPHAIATNQLCNQNLIDANLRESLEGAMSIFTDGAPDMELPHVDAASLLVADLARRAHDDELITDSEARAMLGLDRLAPLPWETEL
jgi:Zn-dependent peptidase ImmA (M78 family)